MQKKSIWFRYLKNEKYIKMYDDKNVDIAIIGGGISGVSVAYYLKDLGYNICLLESNKIGEGISARTTGKITYLQEDILLKINKIYGKDKAREYYKSQKLAIEQLKKIIEDNKIDCDFKKSKSYVFSQTNRDIKRVKELKNLLEEFGENIESVYSLPDDIKIKYGISVSNTYVFNPMKYLTSLKRIIQDNVDIYEKTKVEKICRDKEKYVLKIGDKKVFARKVILCTHYPYFLFPYLMPLKCSLEKSYIALYETKSDIEYNAITINNPTISIRYVEGENKRYKLILAKSHNINYDNDDQKHFSSIWNIGRDPDYMWSNVDIITKDYMPYIGTIDVNFYLATGYNTWGMTNGTLAGLIIKDLLIDNTNFYISLFDPNRGSIKTMIKYPLYAFNNINSFLGSKIFKNKAWYSKNVEFKKIKGVSVGIYRDDKNREHIVKNRCPHMGCSLIFNEVEKTWDCPCHASRFSLDGKVICGPSNYDIKFKE